MEQRVSALVNELPAKQKLCVTLRYLQDLDYPEIVQILSCSQESAVPMSIRRSVTCVSPWRGKDDNTKIQNEVFVVKHLRSALGSPTETELDLEGARQKVVCRRSAVDPVG